jgi:hypothetical protein
MGNLLEFQRIEKAYLIHLALVILIVFIVYLTSIPYPFHFDDRPNITENEAVQLNHLDRHSLTKLFSNQPPSAKNRPVANVTFALNHYVGKLDPRGYRTTNILIHCMNIFLLYFIFRKIISLFMLPLPDDSSSHYICLFACALWGINPLHTESITYIVQRVTSLQALFFLSGLLFFLRLLSEKKNPARQPATILLILALFFLSAGTKETGFLMPLALALIAWLQPKNQGTGKRRISLLYLVIPGSLVLLVVGLILLEPDVFNWYSNENGGFGPLQRILSQPRVLLWYVSLILFPLPGRLNLDIFFPASNSLLSPPTTLITILFWTALITVAHKIRSRYPLATLTVFWFLLLSSVEASFLNLEIAYQHRTYLPSVFIFLILAQLAYFALQKGADKLRINQHFHRSFLIAGIILFTIFGLFTYERNQVFASEIALWSDAVSKSPQKARPYFNLGQSLQDSGKLQSAKVQYQLALKINPDYFRPLANLGMLFENDGDLVKAEQYTQRANDLRPDHGEVAYNLGRYKFTKGYLDESEFLFKQALESTTMRNRGDGFWYLALIEESRNNNSRAIEYWQQAYSAYGSTSERKEVVQRRIDTLLRNDNKSE